MSISTILLLALFVGVSLYSKYNKAIAAQSVPMDNSADEEQEDAFLAADDAEELVAVCEKAVEEKHDARQRQANRHQPARIHPLHLKEVLSHRAGCAPASAAAHGHERT